MLGPILMVVLFLVMRLIVWLSLRDVTSYRKTRKSGKSIKKTAKLVMKEIREYREDSREFKEAMREARWEAQEARMEKAAERFDAVMTGIGALGEKCARKTEEGVRALKDGIEARKAIREQMKSGTIEEEQAEPVIPVDEALMNRIIVRDLEKDAARTATMAANVPTIEFPEEDDKYFSARKNESADD